MMKFWFDVEVELAGSGQWYAVARCLSPESAGAIAAALLATTNGRAIRLNPLPAPEEPNRPESQPPGGFP